MIFIETQKTHFLLRIKAGASFGRELNSIKDIPGAYYLGKQKKWKIPMTSKDFVHRLSSLHKVTMDSGDIPEKVGEIPPLKELTVEPPIQNATLRPYQEKGVAQGLFMKRYIIGDEQGLGKTIQTIGTIITAAQQGEDVFPVLCVVPNSTKINWQREWHKFSNERAMILKDNIKTTWHQQFQLGVANIFIVNYESLKKYFVLKMPKPRINPETGRKIKPKSTEIVMRETIGLFKTIVVDESQRCKNPTTQNSKLCLRLAMGKQRRILLSGTPVVNTPVDLYPQLAILGRLKDFGQFGASLKAFKDRYCNGGKGASNLNELSYILKMNCFFRREKKDVAKDLPSKDRQKMIVEITNRKEYDHAEKQFRSWLHSQGYSGGEIETKLRGEVLVRMNALRQLAALGKIDAMKEFIEDILASGEKLVVFCTLKKIVSQLISHFPGAVTVTGDDDANQKQRNIDKFQTDPTTNLIVCNIASAGVGITLTASSRTAFIELPWNAANCFQCEDRVHRIGQTKPVMCSYFLGVNTIDEWMFDLILDKKEIANAITGATDDMEMKSLSIIADKMAQ